MPIESASFIHQLEPANPAGSDPIADSDNHIRLIKTALKNTFPNITAPVTANQHQLAGLPAGLVCMWSGSIATIPAGWVLCSGQTVARADGTGNITAPDFRNRFIVAAGADYAVGATGGTTGHDHGGTVSSVALTAAQMPVHSHGVSDPGHGHTVNDPGHAHTYDGHSGLSWIWASGSVAATNGMLGPTGRATTASGTGVSINVNGTGISIGNAGGGEAHNHTIGGVDHRPPYYAIAFIMKT